MTVKGILPATEAWIQTLQISNAADQDKVRRCVVEYARPTGFVDFCFHFLAIRIWNAVTSVFGYSSWQLAEAVIQKQWTNKALEIAKENQFNTLGVATLAEPVYASCFAYDFLKMSIRINDPVGERKLPKVFKDLKSMKLFENQIAALKGLASSMSKQPELFINPEAPLSKVMDQYHQKA